MLYLEYWYIDYRGLEEVILSTYEMTMCEAISLYDPFQWGAMARGKIYSVLITLSSGRNLGYLVTAINHLIAIDRCIKQALKDDPTRTFRSEFAYEVSLEYPLCYIDTKYD